MTTPEKQENGLERIPSRENVLAHMQLCRDRIEGRHAQVEVRREIADSEGVYLLEVRIAGKDSGDFTDLIYQRKGNFGNNAALATVIEVVYFENGMPCGGDVIAHYNSETDGWMEKG